MESALAEDQGTAGTVTDFVHAEFWQWRGTQVGVLESALAEGQGTAGGSRFAAEWRTLGSLRDRICLLQCCGFLVSPAAIYKRPPCLSGLF